jgi:hypothetical protein
MAGVRDPRARAAVRALPVQSDRARRRGARHDVLLRTLRPRIRCDRCRRSRVARSRLRRRPPPPLPCLGRAARRRTADAWSLRPGRALRRRSARRRRSTPGSRPRLACERLARSSRAWLALQRRAHRARSLRGRLSSCGTAGGDRTAFGARFRARRGLAQLDAGTPRLRESDGDRLLRRSRPVLSFPDVVDLLTHELTRLGGRCFAGALVASRAFQGFLLRHG